MYCHKCGTETEDDSRYCHACGESLSPEDEALLHVAKPKPETPLPTPEQRKSADHPVHVPTSPATPRGDKSPMKFSTRVAYNILQSDRKNVALGMILLIVLAAGIVAVTSCLGLVSSFATLGDANRALSSGIQSKDLQKAVDAAWRSIGRHFVAIPVSLIVFSLSIRLLVRLKRVAETLKAVRKAFD